MFSPGQDDRAIARSSWPGRRGPTKTSQPSARRLPTSPPHRSHLASLPPAARRFRLLGLGALHQDVDGRAGSAFWPSLGSRRRRAPARLYPRLAAPPGGINVAALPRRGDPRCCCLRLHFITWIAGARMTPAANSTLIVNIVPVVMPLLLWLFAREKLTPRETWATGIATVGLAVLFAADFRISREHFRGDTICFRIDALAGVLPCARPEVPPPPNGLALCCPAVRRGCRRLPAVRRAQLPTGKRSIGRRNGLGS